MGGCYLCQPDVATPEVALTVGPLQVKPSNDTAG